MAVTVLKHIKEAKNRMASAHLKNAIKYVTNKKKTEDGLWVGGNVGTDPEQIYEAMMETKEDFGKYDGRQGYHFVISFSPGEADAETTFKIGEEFCRQYLGDAYDYVFAVHTDQHHSHCHIVFNSVNRINGAKYRYENGDWEKYIQPITDSLCVKHDLPPLEYDRQKKKGKTYAERRAELDGRVTGKDIIRFDIDYAISVSKTFEEFLRCMKKQGYRIREGYSNAKGMPFFTYYAPGLEKGRRDYNLGPGYLIREIKKRISDGKEYQMEDFAPKALINPGKAVRLHGMAAKVPPFPLITNLWRRSEGPYQKSYVLRVVWAVFYHRDLSGIPDSFSVRKDLLQIDKLQEECECLLAYGVTKASQAEKVLQTLKAEEQKLRRTSRGTFQESSKGAADSRLLKIRHDKRILRRILKRDQEEPQLSAPAADALCLPEPIARFLEQTTLGQKPFEQKTSEQKTSVQKPFEQKTPKQKSFSQRSIRK